MARSNFGQIRNALVASVASLGLLLGACSSDGATEAETSSASAATVAVTDNYGEQTIPASLDTIVATDNRSFEILNQWGIKLAAAPKPLIPFTLTDYKNNDSIQDMGSHREPNLEIVAAVQPDLIVNGQRFQQYYDDLKELAPDAAIVEFEPRDGEPLDKELKRQAAALGTIFGKQAEADKLIADFDAALERARKAYNPDMKVMALNSSGGTLGYVAPSVGRTFGPLFDLIGMTEALDVDRASNAHQGDEISVEAIAQSNPDFIMVLDRDAAISTRETAEFKPAKSVIEGSAALRNVAAVNTGKIYYAPEDTYVNESIITYTEILNGLADAFEQA